MLHHHERWDGTGYPEGLPAEQIPLGARIIFVADAYDAMTSDRVYRRKLLDADALAELQRCAGTQFDPEVVAAFVEEFGALRPVPGARLVARPLVRVICGGSGPAHDEVTGHRERE